MTTCSTGPSASSTTQDFQCWRQTGHTEGKATDTDFSNILLTATLAQAPPIDTTEASVIQFISRTAFKENILASSADLEYTSTNQTTISTRVEAKLGWVMTRSNTPCRAGRTSQCRGRQSTTTHFKRWRWLCLIHIQGALCRLDVPSAHWLLCV